MKVLLAETDPIDALTAQSALENVGLEVLTLANSLEVWDRLATEPPDLLITRIVFGPGQVPGTALGARAHAKQIPVIYTPTNARRAVHADAEDGAVLIKPLDLSMLVATAITLLKRSEPHVALAPLVDHAV